jgi:hypothetical protein
VGGIRIARHSFLTRAITSCDANGLKVDNHFAETSKLVDMASDAKREVTDYFLSRAACYLIGPTHRALIRAIFYDWIERCVYQPWREVVQAETGQTNKDKQAAMIVAMCDDIHRVMEAPKARGR